MHCLFAPLAIPMLAVLGVGFVAHEEVNRLLMMVLVPVTFLAVIPGYRQHWRGMVPVLVATGLALLILAGLGAGGSPGHAALETLMTVWGGGLLIVGHALNRYFCSVCRGTPACCKKA
jgi:hypothetical protein